MIHLSKTKTVEAYRGMTECHIDIDTIATNLSNLCRFNGATGSFYSVAEHSMLVADMVKGLSKGVERMALLHDAHEAYIGDIVSPLKKATSIGSIVGSLTRYIDKVIFSKFNLEVDDLQCVKEYDRFMCNVERFRFFVGFGPSEFPCYEVVSSTAHKWKDKIQCLFPAEAKREFLDYWKDLR